MATVKWRQGDHPSAQSLGRAAQKLAKLSGISVLEAQGLRIEAMSCYAQGNYRYSMSLFQRARELLAVCGQTGMDVDRGIGNNQAEIHMLKSEYAEARRIHASIMDATTEEQHPENHVFALLNIAEIDSFLGVDTHEVLQNLETTKRMFVAMGFPLGTKYADTIIAETYLRDGNTLAAKAIFEKCFEMSWRNDSQCVTYCLERLGDFSRWSSTDMEGWSAWTFINFAYGLKSREKLVIHKGLRYLGDIFASHGDNDTAFSLALEGLTWMDLHRSRAECMLRIGNVWEERGDLKKAVEFWESARPLFQRSLQGKGVTQIDTKLGGVPHQL
ncbi:hypothetical protein C8R43DRAFT_1103786 [Mycena crocata]|nr:hypothetical protein C8R43DRAFT_1103786 [Mycena crocata]